MIDGWSAMLKALGKGRPAQFVTWFAVERIEAATSICRHASQRERPDGKLRRRRRTTGTMAVPGL